jgi:acyl-CoA thioester hydrolase
MSTGFTWDLPDPFTIELTVDASHIDRMGHVNHSIYLQWCEQCAWEHAESVQAGWDLWKSLDRGMVVREARLKYLGAALLDDALLVSNWIVVNDARLRARRQFQIARSGDGATLLRGELDYVCVQISTGTPRRIPREFIAAYPVLPSVQAALAGTEAH